jgi:Na+/H+-dicarboxylate symporter/ABC-type amino acid transport substrate-binding protein
MSLSRQILIGVVGGVLVGLFFGERVGFLQVAADAYVKLLQMTVLPYVTVSLVAGLGRLDFDQAKSLALRAGAVLGVLWAIALGCVFLFPLTFPSIETASFFSTTLVQEREPFDLINLYIPANPFYSLANNVVPAVVLFSVVLGVALIGVPTKARLLEVLDVINAAFSRANNLIVRLTPVGIFAIAASAAGTLAIEQFERLQVYLIGYVAVALLVSLWILPGLITTVTPLRYREILGTMRDGLLTAFMTGNLFIVLPMLVEQSQALMRKHGLSGSDAALPEVIVPASFNFPHVGKLLALSFVLFAGWFADASVSVSDYPRLAGTGLVVLFGNINAAIPFLLDLFRIPADTFQLFLATSVVNARFGTLMAAAHTIVMALVGSWAIAGRLEISPRRIVRYVVMSVLLTAATVTAARALCHAVVSTRYERDQMLMGMRLSLGHGPAKTVSTPAANSDGSIVTVDRVRATRVLHVCWVPDALPFAFLNGRGELVGFDVEMAQDLASVLNATAEFVKVPRGDMPGLLRGGTCDLLIGGIVVTAERAVDVRFSKSYLDETLAFVVPDHLRQVYSSWDDIRRRGNVAIAVPPLREYEQKVRAQLPDAKFVPLTSADVGFRELGRSVEALALPAERGSAWTLLHPQFSVAVPRPGLSKVPLAYPIARQDDAFATIVNTWIDLKTKDGTVEALYDRWILGRTTTSRKPRWSILRDVLHWAD